MHKEPLKKLFYIPKSRKSCALQRYFNFLISQYVIYAPTIGHSNFNNTLIQWFCVFFGTPCIYLRADLQRMFHNVTTWLKWEDLQVVVLQYLDGAYTVLFRMFPLLFRGFGGAIVRACAFHLRYRGFKSSWGRLMIAM